MKRTVWALVAAALLTAAGDGFAQGSMHNMLSDAEKSEGWQLLFDGKTLLGWVHRGGGAQWHVEDESITATAVRGPSYIGTYGEFKNFVLKLDFWTDEGHNSGVFIRGPRDLGAGVNQNAFYEINIADQHPTGYTTGSIVDLAKYEPAPTTAGKWNTFEIMAEGRHITVTLNGQKGLDIQDSRHYSGVIALQAFGQGTVKFRNIKIKPLD